jgi:hypothetical protein
MLSEDLVPHNNLADYVFPLSYPLGITNKPKKRDKYENETKALMMRVSGHLLSQNALQL